MNQSILHVLHIVFSACCAQVAVIVEIALDISIYAGGHREKANIKLSALVQERPLTILLDDKRPFLAVYHIVLNDCLNLRKFAANSDSTASIGILAWFHNPELFSHSGEPMQGVALLWVIVTIFEFVEGMVCYAFFDVKSQRHIIEWTLPNSLVIDFHIVVDGLLV